MNPTRHSLLRIVAVLMLFLTGACDTLLAPPPTPLPAPAVVAALTLAAREATMPAFTATPTPYPTSTLAPSATPLPSPTFLPPVTHAPIVTPTPCNMAELVADMTIPAGTVVSPNASFVKIWRLRNAGSCPWTTDYKLTFVGGDRMGGLATTLPISATPGTTMDVAIELTAPEAAGNYSGSWMLSNGTEAFGAQLPNGSDAPLTVSILVQELLSSKASPLVRSYCDATWESDAGSLPCPGHVDAAAGFVVRVDEPNLETRLENEPALWTNPQNTRNGYIRGTFPNVKVADGDHFMADVGCLSGYPRCDVTFQLGYQVKNGAVKALGEWHEISDGKITRIDVDLSPLAEKTFHLVLTVISNGPAKQAAAFWLQPQIVAP